MLELEEDFRHWLASDGMQPQTIRNQLSVLGEFSRFCAENGIVHDTLDVATGRAYMVWLAERPNYHTGKPLAPATRAKHYDALVRLNAFLVESGRTNGYFMDGIRRPIPRKTVIESFSEAQLQLLIAAMREVRTEERYKDRMALLIYLLVSTGLRISEAIGLRINKIDFDRRLMRVIGKGDRERDVPFSTELTAAILDYIAKYQIGDDQYLFASRYGKPLASSSIRDAMRKAKIRIGHTLGIDRMRVSPHTLRHTFARLWVVKGGSTIALSRVLGHTSTSMTSEYVKLWGVDLNASYDLTNPAGGIESPKFK